MQATKHANWDCVVWQPSPLLFPLFFFCCCCCCFFFFLFLLDQIYESHVRCRSSLVAILRLQYCIQLSDSDCAYLGKQSLFINRLNTFCMLPLPLCFHYQVSQYHAIRGTVLYLFSQTEIMYRNFKGVCQVYFFIFFHLFINIIKAKWQIPKQWKKCYYVIYIV